MLLPSHNEEFSLKCTHAGGSRQVRFHPGPVRAFWCVSERDLKGCKHFSLRRVFQWYLHCQCSLSYTAMKDWIFDVSWVAGLLMNILQVSKTGTLYIFWFLSPVYLDSLFNRLLLKAERSEKPFPPFVSVSISVSLINNLCLCVAYELNAVYSQFQLSMGT